jgi:DNA-binding PadR family transcriptional regulator
VSVKYGLLGLLARQPLHGYELKRTFEQVTGGFWQLNFGQIYQTLDRLEHEGWVTHTVEQDEAAPERKVYSLTDLGSRALEAWLAHPEAKVRPLRDELFIRLAVMSSADVDARVGVLDAYRAAHLARMQELTRAKRALEERLADDLETLLLDAAIFHADADLRWLDHCESVLRARRRDAAN